MRRLQFALRAYAKELASKAAGASRQDAERLQEAGASSLRIAEMLDEVVERLNTNPSTPAEIDQMSKFLESDLVNATESQNPFNLTVDIVSPLTAALQELNPEMATAGE